MRDVEDSEQLDLPLGDHAAARSDCGSEFVDAVGVGDPLSVAATDAEGGGGINDPPDPPERISVTFNPSKFLWIRGAMRAAATGAPFESRSANVK